MKSAAADAIRGMPAHQSRAPRRDAVNAWSTPSFRAVAAATERLGDHEPRPSVSLFPAGLAPLVPKMEQYAKPVNVKLIGNA
jgi:hypothetical protein